MADDIATAAPGQQATDMSNADVTTVGGEDHGTGDSHQHGDTLGGKSTQIINIMRILIVHYF
jgi:hypothetical protein